MIASQNEYRPVTVDTGGPDDIWPGALVTWLHTPSGGYGYTFPIDAKVLAVTSKGFVRIEVTTKAGNRRTGRVKAANLRWRGTTGMTECERQRHAFGSGH
jgi:hypothetical protein